MAGQIVFYGEFLIFKGHNTPTDVIFHVSNMRIRLEFPETVLFTFPIRARVTDMNYAQHVGNDRFLVFAQEARSAWFAHLGYQDSDIEGCNAILADAAVQFMAEAFAGDELKVEIGLGGWHKYGLDILYRVVRGSEVVALMKTATLLRDNQSQKLVAPPEKLLQKVKST